MTNCKRRELAKIAAQCRQGRLNEVLNYIIGFKRNHDGCSPSIRQIVASTVYSSTSSVHYALERLEKQKKITLTHTGESRQIMVIGGKWIYNE